MSKYKEALSNIDLLTREAISSPNRAAADRYLQNILTITRAMLESPTKIKKHPVKKSRIR